MDLCDPAKGAPRSLASAAARGALGADGLPLALFRFFAVLNFNQPKVVAHLGTFLDACVAERAVERGGRGGGADPSAQCCSPGLCVALLGQNEAPNGGLWELPFLKTRLLQLRRCGKAELGRRVVQGRYQGPRERSARVLLSELPL